MYAIQYNTQFEVSKKLLSVHTEDRDIKKWPHQNLFEIEAPVDYKNVVSLRLNDIELPSNFYVFSNANQNTMLTFKLIPLHTPGENLAPTVFTTWDYETGMKLLLAPPFTIILPQGTYTPVQLANQITGLMNEAVSSFLNEPYLYFNIMYNPISMKLIFINSRDNFSFNFTKGEPYNPVCGPVYYDNYAQWGLGSYLGFDKRSSAPDGIYTSSYSEYFIYWCQTESINGFIIEAPNTLYIFGEGQIYMELDQYNNIDEIAPYTERSNSVCYSKHSGKHNASFAKIPIIGVKNERWFISRETFLSNIYFNDPPLERIQKFKFKFRYHDGRLVDFNNCNFNFTIEITMLRPDPIKMPIQVHPNHYKLT